MTTKVKVGDTVKLLPFTGDHTQFRSPLKNKQKKVLEIRQAVVDGPMCVVVQGGLSSMSYVYWPLDRVRKVKDGKVQTKKQKTTSKRKQKPLKEPSWPIAKIKKRRKKMPKTKDSFNPNRWLALLD